MRWLALLAALVLAAGGAAWAVERGLIERLLHPARYAVTGIALRPADAYAEAAARAVPGMPLALLRLPTDAGAAVTVEAERATIWLDPPTALVLEVEARAPDPGAAAPLASPSLDPAQVLVRARTVAGSELPLRSLAWPSMRDPDWQVRFAGGVAIDVADDSGVAARARPATSPLPVVQTHSWWTILAAGARALVAVALLIAILRRRQRPRSTRA